MGNRGTKLAIHLQCAQWKACSTTWKHFEKQAMSQNVPTSQTLEVLQETQYFGTYIASTGLISQEILCLMLRTLSHLTCLKKYVEHFIDVLGTSRTEKGEIDKTLRDVTKARPKGVGSRWPRDPTTRIGYFKAEEYQNFVMWILPYMLDCLSVKSQNLKLYDLGVVLVEIGSLYYSHLRTYGWTAEVVNIVRHLWSAWRIRNKDRYRLECPQWHSSCIIMVSSQKEAL